MFRFYSIFYDLYSIFVYLYCKNFVYIIYSVICIVYFWFVFNICPFIIIIIIIIIIISLFQEDNIFGTNASLIYGPRLQR